MGLAPQRCGESPVYQSTLPTEARAPVGGALVAGSRESSGGFELPVRRRAVTPACGEFVGPAAILPQPCLAASRKARRGKAALNRRDVAAFEYDAEPRGRSASAAITCRPGLFRSVRTTRSRSPNRSPGSSAAAPYRDRVVHHAAAAPCWSRFTSFELHLRQLS